MIRAVGYATKKNFFTDTCIRSFERHMKCEFLIKDEPFRWKSIIDYVLLMAQKYPDDVLVPIDLWDCLFIGTVEELEEKIKNKPMVFNATKKCWPDEKLAALYAARALTMSPYKYLNACGPIGYGRDIEEMIVTGNDIYPLKPWDENEPDEYKQDTDQRFYTWLYLHGFGCLDSRCDIFQVLNCIDPDELITDGRRVFNTKTGGEPCILHAAHNTHELIPEGILE